MQCIVCHDVQQEEVGHNSTCHWKCLLVYNKDHGKIAMNQHVFSYHFTISNLYKTQKVIVNLLFIPNSKPRPKKTHNRLNCWLFTFGILYKNLNPIQYCFLKDLTLYIIKGFRPLSSIWLQRLIICQCDQVVFPNKQ
jgi:hypothetical protein